MKWIRELVTGNAAGSADVDVKDTDRVHIRTWRISSTYNIIQQKQLYDEMTEEQQNAVPKERYEEMIADYNRVRPRFVSGRDKTRPRNEWCTVSIYDRAKEAEQLWKQQMEADGLKDNRISLYKTFYRHASSMHHIWTSPVSSPA